MKRLLALVLCMVMLLSVCVVDVSALGNSDFSDRVSSWARNEVRKAVIADLVDHDWFYWADDGQMPVKRAEFCTFLWQLAMQMTGYMNLVEADSTTGTASQKFEDIDDFQGGYFVDAVFNLGLINGVSETRFEPERAVTREEAAVMLYRLFNKFGYETEKADLSEYKDVNLVSDWAKDAVAALWSCEPFVSVLNNDEIIPQETISYEQVIVMRWRFYEEKYGEQKILFYEDTTPEILVELELVSDEELEKEGNITVKEVLEIASKIPYRLEDVVYPQWDEIEKYVNAEGLDDSEKQLLIYLNEGILNPFFAYEDFGKINFDADITYGDAYTYMLRCVENEGDYVAYDMMTDVEDVYSVAFEIGLIDSADTQNSDKPIPRQEFYKLLHRTVFCDYTEVWPVMRDYGWLTTNYVERKLGVENEEFINMRAWYPEGWEE